MQGKDGRGRDEGKKMRVKGKGEEIKGRKLRKDEE